MGKVSNISRESAVMSRQFSPDPLINYGFMAFMVAMGLDIVYKMAGVLKYFDAVELE